MKNSFVVLQYPGRICAMFVEWISHPKYLAMRDTFQFHPYLSVINNEMMSVERDEAEGEGGGEGEDEGAGQGEVAEQGEGRKGPVGHRVELQG